MKSKFKKLSVVLVAVSMVLTLSGNGKSLAYFNDTATITGTTFTAGTLEINIDSTADFVSGPMYPNDATTTSVTASNVGSLDFQYLASSTFDGDYAKACDYVNINASSPRVSFTGLVKDFSSATSTLITSNSETWDYSFTVDSNAPSAVWGKTCSFKLTYKAWQEDVSDSSTGFYDIKEKIGRINIGKAVVMNEVLPNPEGDDAQNGIQGEWVELYNNSGKSINLAGWKIKDAGNHTITISSANVWNGRTTIGAKGSGLEWVVVFMNGEILNNTGDTVSFYDSENNLIDQYAFGDSVTDPDSDSNNTPVGNNQNPAGTETKGNEGKSYARIPDGIGGWVDPIPTPGGTNDFSLEMEVPNIEAQVVNNSIVGSEPAPVVEPEEKSDTTIEEDVITDATDAAVEPTEDANTGDTEQTGTNELIDEPAVLPKEEIIEESEAAQVEAEEETPVTEQEPIEDSTIKPTEALAPAQTPVEAPAAETSAAGPADSSPE